MKIVAVTIKVTLPDDDPRSADDVAEAILNATEVSDPSLNAAVEGWRIR